MDNDVGVAIFELLSDPPQDPTRPPAFGLVTLMAKQVEATNRLAEQFREMNGRMAEMNARLRELDHSFCRAAAIGGRR